LLASCLAARCAETVVVTADRMIDVLAGRVVERPAVVIVNGRNQRRRAAGAGERAAGAGGSILPERRSCPGLIDMHVHLAARR
jgi:imidazolonepropionase-like amidohydrolase